MGSDTIIYPVAVLNCSPLVPSVVDNAIQSGVVSPGKYSKSTQYLDSVNKLRVIVNSDSGRVITVIPGVK